MKIVEMIFKWLLVFLIIVGTLFFFSFAKRYPYFNQIWEEDFLKEDKNMQSWDQLIFNSITVFFLWGTGIASIIATPFLIIFGQFKIGFQVLLLVILGCMFSILYTYLFKSVFKNLNLLWNEIVRTYRESKKEFVIAVILNFIATSWLYPIAALFYMANINFKANSELYVAVKCLLIPAVR